MHRVRSWARAKAHGSAPLTAKSKRLRAAAAAASNCTASGTHQDVPNIIDNGAAATAEASTSGQDEKQQKKPLEQRNVAVRFFLTIKDILFSSPVNVLLVFVPIGIAVHFANLSAGIVFAMNAIAIIPLAGLLSHATESVARRLGDTIGALMNVTFGNAVELIIFIALVKNEIQIVQASLVGSILANLLLILGMCFLLGGLRFREQIYNSTVTQMSACLLSLSVSSLLLPTAFHASFSNESVANQKVIQVSRGLSVVLLLVYGLYLVFQLNSHAYMYESTPQHIIEQESVPGPAANYFNSSSSSETSSSSSDSGDSNRSRHTAKRIKRAIKKRTRRHSTSSDDENAAKTATRSSPRLAEPSRAPMDQLDLTEPAIDPNLAADDEADEAPDARPHRKKNRKRLKRRSSKEVATAEMISQQDSVEPTAVAREGGNESRRVDFVLGPDVEAQTEPRGRPFSLRAIRPALPKTLSQNVFTTRPQNPAQGLSPALGSSLSPLAGTRPRRASSLPPERRGNRNGDALTSLPPIVPIVVNSTPKRRRTVGDADGDEEEEEEPEISRTTAILLLLGSTALVALCAEFMVGSINDVVSDGSGLSSAFIGLILLPIVGNAAEHVTAVTVALKNKMDLAIGVALGSSIQIALFVTPLVVILGWIMGKDMSLFFTLFETVSLFVSAFIVNFLVLDGRSNYLEGALLCAAYIIIAVAAFFYPNAEAANSLGGGDEANSTSAAAVEASKLLVRGMASLAGRL